LLRFSRTLSCPVLPHALSQTLHSCHRDLTLRYSSHPAGPRLRLLPAQPFQPNPLQPAQLSPSSFFRSCRESSRYQDSPHRKRNLPTTHIHREGDTERDRRTHTHRERGRERGRARQVSIARHHRRCTLKWPKYDVQHDKVSTVDWKSFGQ